MVLATICSDELEPYDACVVPIGSDLNVLVRDLSYHEIRSRTVQVEFTGQACNAEGKQIGFGFRTTMTRYAVKRKYDGIGVPPDVQLRYDQDWVRQTVGLF